MSQPKLSQVGLCSGISTAPLQILSVEKLVENSLQTNSSVEIPATYRSGPGDSASPDIPCGIASAPNLVADTRNTRERACLSNGENGHASDLKELIVASRERFPFDAIGGVVLRLLFVGGPDLSFFLSELGNPTFLELVSVCTQMFGIPVLANPRRTR